MKVHEAIRISRFAQLYYKLKTGEVLDSDTARNRFNSTKHKDLSICDQVNNLIYAEQKEMIKNEK